MVFVTGGTGLIGSHLLYELALRDYRIKAIKRNNSSIDQVYKIFRYYSKDAAKLFDKIEWVVADMRDKYALHYLTTDVKDVYHCAGYISFNRTKKWEMSSVNIAGTANIVNACMENNIRKFCYVSSIATLSYDEGAK
ncbi:MAG: NAD-dependent epimerase/dehydratase family protein [Bacteroidales bacterium]|nr:NAD-dependent epimerase/dehydratase family protein [Bacteroidales bacterium]